MLVCDECFIDFVIDSEEYSIKNYLNEKCIILKAFTKIYAVPGIRLGYAVCGSRAEAEKIASTGQYWSVSSLAQRVGLTALDETKYIHRTVGLISRERRFLEAELKKAGVKTYHSDANFLLFKSSEILFAQMILRGKTIHRRGNDLPAGIRVKFKALEFDFHFISAVNFRQGLFQPLLTDIAEGTDVVRP